MVGAVRPWAVCCVFWMVLASGCAEAPPQDPVLDEAGPVDAGQANVTVPVAIATVLLNGTALESDNGTFLVPAGVNVTFDASSSRNATGFSWTFADRNGTTNTTEGVEAVFMFAAGNHTVTLAALAGNLSSAQTLNVTATSLAPAVLSLVETTAIAFSKAAETWVAGCRSAVQALEFPAGTVTQHVRMVLDPSWTGVAVNVQFALRLLDAGGDKLLEVVRAGGSANLELVEDGLALDAGSYTAQGEFCATGANGVAPQGSFTVTGQADHYA